MHIQGKVFVVTGAGNGIAREVTLQILSEGGKVAAVDLSEEALKETEQLAGGPQSGLSLHTVDISDADRVEALPNEVIQQHGQVDGLLNIAGIIQKFVPVKELTLKDIEKVINVNLYGVINTVHSFLPHLIARPEASLINVSSMGAYTPVPGQSIYGATKAAVASLTNGLHSELMKTNVHVTTVFPGAIGTKIAQNSGVMTDEQAAQQQASADSPGAMKTTSPADAGKVIVDAIKKPKYHAFIGQDARMLNLMSRLAPKKTAGMIYKKMASLLG